MWMFTTPTLWRLAIALFIFKWWIQLRDFQSEFESLLCLTVALVPIAIFFPFIFRVFNFRIGL